MGTRGRNNARLLALALALGVAGCDDSKEETPPPKDGGGGFTDVDADVSEQDAARPDSARPDGGTPAEDGDTPDGAGSCEASAAEADEKEWAEGCYKCAPETHEQLLNRCATGWRTFDPEQYPNGWRPGDDLPSLP